MTTKKKQGSTRTRKAAVKKDPFICPYCEKVYTREGDFLRHLCSQRARYSELSTQQSKIAYMTWRTYFTTNHPTINKIEQIDFIKSPFYSAFMKFAEYCVETKVINPQAYSRYLLKNAVLVDKWGDDTTYLKFLGIYLRLENCVDAVKRSLEFLTNYCETAEIELQDVFRKTNPNLLVDMVYFGKISPWLLFQTESGIEFLDKLNDDQYKKIALHINPEAWAKKFAIEPDNVAAVTAILNTISKETAVF